MKVGFIGLGTMGFPMASHLAAAGHALTYHDASPAVMERAGALRGAAAAGNPAQVAAACEVLFTALPNNDVVRAVYLGAEGVQAGAHEGLITCDCSTVSPEVSIEVGAALAACGATHMETPMLGSAPQAEDGTVFFIVAGDERCLPAIAPALEAMGRLHMFVGGPGTGNRIKLIHNALGAVNSAAVAESLAVCVAAGVEPETFFQVVSNGGGMALSTYFDKRVQRVIEGEFSPTFTLDLMLKDVTLAGAIAEAGQVPVPILDETRATYREAAADGHGGEDFSAVSKVIEKRVGKKLFGK